MNKIEKIKGNEKSIWKWLKDFVDDMELVYKGKDFDIHVELSKVFIHGGEFIEWYVIVDLDKFEATYIDENQATEVEQSMCKKWTDADRENWERLLKEEDELVKRMASYLDCGERIQVKDKLRLLEIEIELARISGCTN